MFSLSETNIIATDLATSRDFYVNILGFEEVGEDSGAVRLKKDGHYFLILPVASEKNPTNEGVHYSKRAQISFDLTTKDIVGAHTFCVEQQCRVEPATVTEHTDYFVLFDPDGNAIEIVGA